MLRLTLALLLLATAPSVASQEVKVRLFEGRSGSSARFTAVDATISVRLDGREIAQAHPGQVIHVERQGSGIKVAAENVRERGTQLELASSGETRVRADRNDRTYLGRFTVSAAGRALQLVNTVPIEPYVASVVATEYPFSEIEGTKAQAVLARTYAIRHQGDHAGYDVEDSQRSQVYRGTGAVTDVSSRAANETAGQILKYGSEVVEAVYSSSSGGHTADNEAIWHTSPVPYLRGRPDPYDADAPDHRWTARASQSRVHASLARYARGTTGLSIVERSPSGRAVRIELRPSGKTITGSQFRAAVNAQLGWRTIKSTHLDIQASGGQYVFNGRGFGHGVGMSQYGARGHARAGYSYQDILAFYFAGTHVESQDGAPGALVASRPDALRRMPTRRAVAWGHEAPEADTPAAASGETRIVPPAPADAPRTTAPRIDTRPAWVVRDALPNGPRVRSRPTPRAQARQEAAADTTSRTGW